MRIQKAEILGEGHCNDNCDSASGIACGFVVIFCNVLEEFFQVSEP